MSRGAGPRPSCPTRLALAVPLQHHQRGPVQLHQHRLGLQEPQLRDLLHGPDLQVGRRLLVACEAERGGGGSRRAASGFRLPLQQAATLCTLHE